MKQHLKDIALGAALAVLLLGTAKAASDIWGRAYNNYAVPTNNVAIAQSMAVPPLVSATATSTGGSLITSTSTAKVPTWYFVVEAVDPNGGATLPSNEISATLATSTGATSSVALVWGAVQGAVSYNIFYATSSGNEANYQTTTASTYTFATTTGTAAIPTTINTAFVNVVNPNGNSYLSGSLQVQHINGITGATIAMGTGAGSGATDTISYATDLSGVITIHTGSSPSTTQPIFIVKYAQAYAKAPACIIDAQNSAASALAVGARPYMLPTTTSTAAMSNTTALGATTVYQWNWICSN